MIQMSLRHFASKLLLLILPTLIILLLSRLCLLPPHTPGTPTTKRGRESKIDVFLRIETDNERGNVDNLFAHTVSPIRLAAGSFLVKHEEQTKI